MEFIIYSDANNTLKTKLRKEVTQVLDYTPDIVFDFDSLNDFREIKVPDQVVLIILISSNEELESLILNKHVLFNRKIILLLPYNDRDLVSRALSLYPRYLGYPDHEFKDVSAVIKKMIQYETRIQKSLLSQK